MTFDHAVMRLEQKRYLTCDEKSNIFHSPPGDQQLLAVNSCSAEPPPCRRCRSNWSYHLVQEEVSQARMRLHFRH
jgi:hypothetical protein